MPLAASLLAITLVSTLASCSLVAMQRAPSGQALKDQGAAIECTDGLTYPLADMVGTVLTGVLAVSLSSTDNEEDLKTATYTSAGVAVALAASAIYGMFQVQRCRSVKLSSGTVVPGDATPKEDREPPGTHGGACKADGSCEDDLYCDVPMQVCVPLNARGANL